MDKQQYLQQIAENFRANPLIPVPLLLLGLGPLLVMLGAWWAIRRWQMRRHRSSPFVRLSRTVGLRSADQRLLMRVAACGKLPSPITLLLSPATLQHHGRAYVQSQSDRRAVILRRRIDMIGRLIFGPLRSDRA